jgi:hypothetical protein
MPIIMIFYYIICVYLAIMLTWNFIREKQNKQEMLLYLIVLIPLILRIFRIK